MNPTYHDFCVNILVRMGEEKNVEDGLITHTAAVTSYLKAIPALLNEALALLATAGKYVVKHIDIAQEGGGEGIVRRDLGTLAEDFFSLAGREIFFQSGGTYGPSTNHTVEAGRYFVTDASEAGVWTVYYNAYPQCVPADAQDDYELAVDPEVYAVLPLYVEGKLRLISDEDYALTILNEFEARRAELAAANARPGYGAVTAPAPGVYVAQYAV